MTDKLEEHDDIIEVFIDYKKGLRTLKTATAEMVRLGFSADVAYAMLKSMKKHNVIDIRNKSYQPTQLTEGKARAKAERERKTCASDVDGVDTDNK
tara:strand:+ start:1938 stop:2225 length:288 start_codon:yes stop_codon:yes gene_type:complete